MFTIRRRSTISDTISSVFKLADIILTIEDDFTDFVMQNCLNSEHEA